MVRKLPFIPLESEIDALIAGCGPKTSTLLYIQVGKALFGDESEEFAVKIAKTPEEVK